ncbi:hypothetical protein EC973_006403 [Apophysomyces ossiformis]|uniref:Vacuolar protein sorting-associated protein n=1 Tax=Apophysomyces ossiformis TaxID=679940 RepID=A0A8H7BZH8_9FUNG|nr:hypothetical protein EC973_006403 [Apophysomyces ossiformis]
MANQTHNVPEDSKNETFANQLMTKILNNLQFSITNIHVRYEDDISTPGQRFAAGVTLSELSAVTTDEKWVPQTISDILATLESLSVYWNTNSRSLARKNEEDTFLSFRELVKLNKKFGGEIPKVDATLLFDELSFLIDDEQYRDAIMMIDLFHSYWKKQKYQKLHPPSHMTPRSNPREFFKFAAEAVLSEIRERNRQWTWDHFKERRDDRLRYLECYVAQQLGHATPEQLDELNQLERRLSYEDIRFYRSISRNRLKREKAKLAAEEKRRREEIEKSTGSSGWLSSWWYGTAPPIAESETADQELVITEEQKQEFYDAIEYDEDKAAVAESIEFPKDTIFLSLRTTLNKGSFTVQRNPHAEKPIELLSLVYDTVMLGAVKYVDSWKATAALGDIRLYDGITLNSQYRQLMGVKKKDDPKRRQSKIDQTISRFINMKDPFFSITFEHKPFDGRADNAIQLIMRNLDIVYNALVIREILDFFRPPETSIDSINALMEVAGDTLEGIKQQTQSSLELALEQHTTLDLHVDMDAPVIVIPEDCTSKSSRGIVLDAGHINVESKLAPPEVVSQMKAKKAIDYTSEDYIRLRSLMYDKFTVDLTQTKILVGDSVETCLSQVRQPKEKYNYLHVVDRIDVTFLVEMCIIRKSADLPKFRISGHLPLLHLNFSDTKYRMIMQIPRLIEQSGLLNNEANGDDDMTTLEEQPNVRNQRRESVRQSRLWKAAEQALFLDTDDSEQSDVDSDAKSGSASHTDFTSVQYSVTTTERNKNNRSEVSQKILQLNFKVDKVLANILKSSSKNDPSHTSSETLLCELSLEKLSLDYSQRPYDMFVTVSLTSLHVRDRMEHGNEFQYLVTSDQDMLQPVESQLEMDTKDLVNVEYTRVSSSSPEYVDKYNGFDQTAKVALSTLNFIVTRSSVLTLYNFVLDTFVEDEETLRSEQPNKRSSLYLGTRPQRQTSLSMAPSTQKQSNNIQVELLLDSVNFILNNDGVRLATGELSHGEMSTLLINGKTHVSAKFANFTLTNDLVASTQAPYKALENQLLTIQGEELINLHFESFINDGSQDYPGYDQSLYLRVGSALFRFQERPVSQLLEYLSKFAAMKSLYDRARQAAIMSAQQFQEANTKTHFDIVVKSPVVLFHATRYNPQDVITAQLGELWASNSFVQEKDGCVNTIQAGIRTIKLTSKFHLRGSPPRKIEIQSLSILDDTDLNFDIKCIHETTMRRPEVEIQGVLSNISMRLTEQQYVVLMDIVNTVSRMSSATDKSESALMTTQRKDEVDVSKEYRRTSDVSNSLQLLSQKQNISSNQTSKIQLSLTSEMIALELFRVSLQSNDEASLSSLACIALNDTSIHCDVSNEDKICVSMKVRSMTVDDTRPNVKSKFTNIMPAIENGNQFEMQLDLSAPEPSRHGIALMVVNDPKVILSLDHAFMLRDFFMSAFVSRPTTTSKTSKQEYQNGTVEQSEDEIDISYRLNVINPEFILLADPDSDDSKAVVLSAEHVMISQQAVMALAVRQMGMFLCRMDTRNTSTLKFIQRFDISVSMNNNTLSGQSGQLTELEVDVDALVLRLSYSDAILVTEIFNKAYTLYNASVMAQESSASAGTSYIQNTTVSSKQVRERIDDALSKESLRATFQGVQVILIEEIHEMPMIDITLKPFNVDVVNWSRSLAVEVNFQTYVNYFNVKNSHWEPLVEPWAFKLCLSKQGSKSSDPIQVKLLSDSELNVNVTHAFLESTLTLMRLWSKQGEFVYSGERGTIAPYRIRNWTGYRIHIWSANSVGTTDNDDIQMKQLDDGEETAWWFEDWRIRRETTASKSNLLNLQVESGSWESLKNVSVDAEGEHMYQLEADIQDVSHRVIFDIKLVDNVKTVTIRSATVIENRTLLPVEIVILDHTGRVEKSSKKIAPGDDYAIPIEAAYHNRFCIRPDGGFGYKWTERALYWKDFIRSDAPTTIKCNAKAGDMPPFIFQVHARVDKKDPLFGQYPAMAVRLSAPVEIENLLPYDFNFHIIDKTAGQNFTSFLRKGGIAPIHVIENGHLLFMNVTLLDTMYGSSEFAIISTKGTDDLEIDHSFQVKDRNNVPLTLSINMSDIPNTGGARRYTVSCRYIVINKTGRAITFKEKPAWTGTMFSGPPKICVCQPGVKHEPFMYSYQKSNVRNRSLIQVTGSEWSQPFSLDGVGRAFDIAIPTTSKTEEIHFGVSVQEGLAQLTNVVTIAPRFILSNQMEESIRYRQPGSRADRELEPKQRAPVNYLHRNAEKQLSVKLPGINNAWSASFNIDAIGVTHVRLNTAEGATVVLMRVTVVLEDATIFIILTKEKIDGWPYLLINNTDEDMTFYQEDISILSDDYRSNASRSKMRRYKLPAHQSVPYAWDMPSIKVKKLTLNIYGRERSISLQEIGVQVPFQHTTRTGRKAITSIDVKTQESCQVLYLTPFNERESSFRPTSSSSASTGTTTQDDFEVIQVEAVFNFTFQLQLSQIGISVVDQRLQEIVYITFRGFDVSIKDSNLFQSLRWNIHWVQVDNQSYGTNFPILLYPTNVTKEGDKGILPTLQVALDRVKDDSHGVLFFKYFSVLLQKISIEIDEELIYRILKFARLDIVEQDWADESKKQLWEYSMDIPDIKPKKEVAQLFFEILHIQPIHLDFSFSRTNEPDTLEERKTRIVPLAFIFNILTMALGNIDAASLKFDALAVENLRASGPDLAERILFHYSDQALNQFHKIVGSADFLGNPVGLFTTLSSGVAELFYEPWQGLIMSDGPQDLGDGISRGVSGFLRKSVFGFTNSFTRITGSLGKGLSAATMDRQYQEERRMNMARNRPSDPFRGFSHGTINLANSFVSGLHGLVAPKTGSSAVTKPVVGVLDFTSNVTEGMRNAATPTGVNVIERIRPPRFMGQEGFLKPYSLWESQGEYWLKEVENGEFFNDDYVAHCYVQDNERIAMVTSQRLLMLKTRRLAVEWTADFTEIQTIRCELAGIAIFLQDMSRELFLIIPNKSRRDAFFKKIEETVLQYNKKRRLALK